MAKRHNLATRAFGAEPGLPDVAGLAEWIAEHRGREADITTYLLDRSLAPQVSAGIGVPCAGGKFYTDRIRQCIDGILDTRAVGELHVDTPAIIEDAAGIVVQKKGAWCAVPAPRLLGISDAYYDDEGEWNDALHRAYRTILRAMRDTGVPGHILIASRMDDAELAALARPNVLFFAPEPCREDLACLLEHQQQVAVTRNSLPVVFDLMNEYPVRKLFLLDPDSPSIQLVLTHLDPDQVVAAGYCMENSGEYWKDLISRATYER